MGFYPNSAVIPVLSAGSITAGTITGTTSIAGGTLAGTTLATSGIISANAGTSSAGSAPVLTPVFANGVASQLATLTRDFMVMLECTTAGTLTTIAIGPTSTPANTIMSSQPTTAGTVYTFRLPAGWWVEWAGTTTAFATQTAIGC
jgi:hypothetical protein